MQRPYDELCSLNVTAGVRDPASRDAASPEEALLVISRALNPLALGFRVLGFLKNQNRTLSPLA